MHAGRDEEDNPGKKKESSKRKREDASSEGIKGTYPANNPALNELCEHAAQLVGAVVVLCSESLCVLLEGGDGAFGDGGDLCEGGECGVDGGSNDGLKVGPEVVAVVVRVLQAHEEILDARLHGRVNSTRQTRHDATHLGCAERVLQRALLVDDEGFHALARVVEREEAGSKPGVDAACEGAVGSVDALDGGLEGVRHVL